MASPCRFGVVKEPGIAAPVVALEQCCEAEGVAGNAGRVAALEHDSEAVKAAYIAELVVASRHGSEDGEEADSVVRVAVLEQR